MDIAILAPSPVPFCVGGAEKLWWGLQRYINETTRHHAELIKIPTREHTFWDLVDSYHAFSCVDLQHFDLVITSKYPAWMARHERHVVYLQHRLRGLYDTYSLSGQGSEVDTSHPAVADLVKFLQGKRGDPQALGPLFDRLEALRGDEDVPPGVFSFPGPLARSVVRFLDDGALHPSRIYRYAAISRTVASRSGYFPAGVRPVVVHHPSNINAVGDVSREYFLTVGRLDSAKRIGMLIDAVLSSKTQRKLKVAGTGPELARLRAQAHGDPRIEFLGYVSDAEVEKLYSRALAVLYVPYDEDYGLVTVEAMQCGKAVITTTDSGGVREFVEDGVSGFVVPPDAKAIADVLEFVDDHPEAVVEMSEECRRRVAKIGWQRVVETLCEEQRRTSAGLCVSRTGRRKVVVTTTFPVWPPRGGGQVRVHQLCRRLADEFDIEILSLAEPDQSARRIDVAPHVAEVRVAKTAAHADKEWRLSCRLGGIPITDVAMPKLYAYTPEYVETLRQLASSASVLIASHPYVFPALQEVSGAQPFIYEAQDVEVALKRAILPDNPLGRYFLRLTESVERLACQLSHRVLACCEEDATSLSRMFGVSPDKMVVVPNGVDAESIPFRSVVERRRRPSDNGVPRFTVLFLGSWHGPNIDAVLTLMEVARRTPWSRFVVVGSVCEYFRRWHCPMPANMELVGVVEDHVKLDLLGTADLAVNPVETGSGTNLKMLEYLASGVPVLTTPFGARGLGLQDGVHAHIASLVDFPDVIQRVADTSEVALEEMVCNARVLVETRFSWDSIARTLADAVRRVLARAEGPPRTSAEAKS